MTADTLHAWIHIAFGDREFTVADFAETFPSPAPAKTLHDLASRDFVESVGRGRYRAVPAETRVQRIIAHEEAAYGLPERSGLPYAYSEDTAVSIWTDGGYWTGFTRGFRPVHLQVRRKDVPSWRRFFHAVGARVTVEGARETLYGVVHVLHPVESIRAVRRGGVSVVSRPAAYAFAASRPYLYEPVLRTLRPRGRAR